MAAWCPHRPRPRDISRLLSTGFQVKWSPQPRTRQVVASDLRRSGLRVLIDHFRLKREKAN
jgi:hypothetical protein